MTSATNPIFGITALGQSIWMDNLSRDLIESGDLKRMISADGIRGITSNPAIFEKAIAGNAIYDGDIEAGIRAGKSVLEIYESLTFADIRQACDIFLPLYQESQGSDGFVSIEVPPTIAKDTDSTIGEARRYAAEINRPNVMIKIPGTQEGLPAVEQVIREGINVNVTLLFSLQSYIETFWAYIRGLEGRREDGNDISQVASVASFFLSRIDTKIDQQLENKIAASDDPQHQSVLAQLKGKVAIANAKLAYQAYKEILQTDRWQSLAQDGAKVQRLLWASTSTKDPSYSDVMYVDELVGPDTVNTLPPDTIAACEDHCAVESRVESNLEAAHEVIDQLKSPPVEIDLDRVMAELLEEGIDKFVQPFESLLNSLEQKAQSLVTT
ncbi:transaldolase [Lyngbya confervoides]|uniref:Transaldolase n=1 Tax=Lyngbya confervoides BDU141951 TaxID=1574623 RepID=A0ABD4T645_9CYAN|nr:transaldolase [Lyngbya confervoides]MCM1984174.1 transaldolase [Lyngbya confervoides BDU141951]